MDPRQAKGANRHAKNNEARQLRVFVLREVMTFAIRMNDYLAKENDALAECIRQDASGELYRAEETIMRLEAEKRCVLRAMWLMALLGVLAAASLGYSVILLHDVAPYYTRLIHLGISVVGLAAIISLLAYVGVCFHLQRQSATCREKVRRLILKLLAERSRDERRRQQESTLNFQECSETVDGVHEARISASSAGNGEAARLVCG